MGAVPSPSSAFVDEAVASDLGVNWELMGCIAEGVRNCSYQEIVAYVLPMHVVHVEGLDTSDDLFTLGLGVASWSRRMVNYNVVGGVRF